MIGRRAERGTPGPVTAALADPATDVFWRPSAALQVVHGHRRGRSVLQAVVATICAFAIIAGAASDAFALDSNISESGAAAQTSADQTIVGSETAERPTSVGESRSAFYDSTSGCSPNMPDSSTSLTHP